MNIYLIFSRDGFNEVFDDRIGDNASLWLNSDLLSTAQIEQLKQHAIDIHFFADFVDGSNEKAILSVLEMIEKQNPKATIFVEYN